MLEILLIVVVAYFALVIFKSLILLWLRNESKSWKMADGVIISCSYGAYTAGITQAGFMIKGGYKVKIKYAYNVDGKEYTGNRISFSDVTFPSSEIAARFADNYNIGDKVKVYYSPKRKRMSVLMRVK